MTVEGISRLENAMSLLDGIKEFVDEDEYDEEFNTEDKSLVSYLQTISLITEMDTADPQADYITLMSIHSAKGLEFDAVLVTGLEENLFPSYMSMNSAEQLDEERRLFYVAITRARKLLSLSYATSRYFFGNLRRNEKSRFINEIDAGRYESQTGARKSIFNLEEDDFTPRKIYIPSQKPSSVNSALLDNFKASPIKDIREGVMVLHQKFGKGTVVQIDGNNDMKIATIHFDEVSNPERKIILKYAKLQVL